METTKKSFMERYPKSYLAVSLSTTTWAGKTKIIIISGLVAPTTKNSNLYDALKLSRTKRYVTGGKLQRASQGVWMAVDVS